MSRIGPQLVAAQAAQSWRLAASEAVRRSLNRRSHSGILSADEGAFLVEMVVDRALDCGELPQPSHSPEAKHRPFSSSEWLVGVLGAVVQPTSDFAPVDGAGLLQGGTVGRQSIRDHHFEQAMPSKRISEELQRRLLVAALLCKASSASPSRSTARQR